MAGRRVLVTGARGFIGRHVVLELVRTGHEVHAAGRAPGPAMDGVRWHDADLLDPAQGRALAASARAEWLLHLAWNAVPGRFWAAPDNLDWVAGSLALVRAFAAAGGTRAVFAGTCAEYDWSHALLDEATTPLRPATLYGVAKDALRRVVEASATPLGITMAWGRVFFLYGPGEPTGRLVPDIVGGIARGQPVDCSAGSQQRDFMHVEDVARAFVALLESPVCGAVNIASGTCRPVRDLVMLLAAALGRPDLIRLGARPTPEGEPAILRAATRILAEQVGFRPSWSLEQGVRALAGASR